MSGGIYNGPGGQLLHGDGRPVWTPSANLKPHIVRFHMIRKADCFKSNWFLWECEAEMLNGDMIHGFVQADFQGEAIAKETFEAEE